MRLRIVPCKVKTRVKTSLRISLNAGIKCYVICDLGGGTADIACHEIDENERPVVGRGGSTYVDQHFCALLDDIFRYLSRISI